MQDARFFMHLLKGAGVWGIARRDVWLRPGRNKSPSPTENHYAAKIPKRCGGYSKISRVAQGRGEPLKGVNGGVKITCSQTPQSIKEYLFNKNEFQMLTKIPHSVNLRCL